MSYFNEFPYLQYEFPNGKDSYYKNISIRPAIVDALVGDLTNLEVYYVENGETPETIAFDVYDDPGMNWVIMLTNNVMNIYTDWPMSEETLESVLYDKYRMQKDSEGVERRLSNLQVAEFLDFVGQPSNNYTSDINLHDSDNSPKVQIRPHHFVDPNGEVFAFDTFSISKDAFGRTITDKPTLTPVSHYEYERSLNEEKRRIYIPSQNIANRMKRELGRLVNG